MQELLANIWQPKLGSSNLFWDVLLVPTNGDINRFGEAVMGRGVALQVKQRYPGAAFNLGRQIRKSGNVPLNILQSPTTLLLSFPVKHHWHEQADLALIQQSLLYYDDLARTIYKDKTIFLPRPGCGNGGLDWTVVGPYCSGLPNNVYVVDLP